MLIGSAKAMVRGAWIFGVLFLFVLFLPTISAEGDAGNDSPPAETEPIFPGANGEPGNILHYPGTFVATPDTSELILGVPPDARGYPLLNLTFDMTAGPWREDFSQGMRHGLFRIENACSMGLIAKTDVIGPRPASEAITEYKARGADKASGTFYYEDGQVYEVQATIDLVDETASLIVKGGDSIQELRLDLNVDQSNPLGIDATREGLFLRFGGTADLPASSWMRPLGWSFSDIRLDTTTGEAPVSQGADLRSDAGRLALLAANMISVAENSGYSLDCGPGREVLALPPEASDSQPFCVLKSQDEIIFGTFREGDDPAAEILASLKNPIYEAHISQDAIDATACDDVLTSVTEFQECQDAISGMNAYAFLHPSSRTGFLIVSEDPVDAFDTSVIESIVGFFARIFGIASDEGKIASVDGLPLRKFHHAYFSESGDRSVSATWYSSDATMIFKEFTTNVSDLAGEDGAYLLGHDNRQILQIDLDEQSSADVQRWRKLTAAIRLQPQSGPPIQGDVCGNGDVGFDEQCEPGSVTLSCSDFDPSWPAVPVGCSDECRYDLSACGLPEGGTCIDDPMPEEPDIVDECEPYAHNLGVCLCRDAVWKALDGIYVDFARRPGVGTPAQMFESGGSQNIPLACAAAKYMQEGEPMLEWWNAYFDYQEENDLFMGTEFFSHVYGGGIMKSVVAAREESSRRGHADIEQKAEDWLSTYWAILSLAALPGPMDPYTMHVAGTTEQVPGNREFYKNALVSAMPGARTLPIQPVWSTQNAPFTLALNYGAGSRYIGGRIDRHSGDALRFIYEIAGIASPEDETVDFAQAVPAEKTGLTEEQRETLRRFVTTDEGFEGVKSMVGNDRPVTPVTFLRTNAGIAVWFGTWEDGAREGFNPNGNKPGIYAFRMLRTGETEILHPALAQKKSGMGGGNSGRTGDAVCAEWREGPEICFNITDLLSSGLRGIYEWSRENGLRQIPLNCEWEDVPTPWPGDSSSQGSYKIQVRQGINPQIRFLRADSPSFTDGCFVDDNEDTREWMWAQGPFNHTPGEERVIYVRHKAGSKGTYNVEILLKADATGWTITGNPETSHTANEASKAHTCWACTSGSRSNDPAWKCAGLDIRIGLAEIPACRDSLASAAGGSEDDGNGDERGSDDTGGPFAE